MAYARTSKIMLYRAKWWYSSNPRIGICYRISKMLALEEGLCGDRTAQLQNQVALKNEWHSTLGPVPASSGPGNAVFLWQIKWAEVLGPESYEALPKLQMYVKPCSLPWNLAWILSAQEAILFCFILFCLIWGWQNWQYEINLCKQWVLDVDTYFS